MQLPEDLVDSFAALDRARLARMSDPVRARALDARHAPLEYVEALWQDVHRAGEHPDIGQKYLALAVVRELTQSLTAVAFAAVYDREFP